LNLAAALMPASLGVKQALRLRRFGVASLSYVLASAMIAIGWMFGSIPISALVTAVTAFVAVNLALYAVIRSGFNLRFADPSLTHIQIVSAMTVLMYVVYHMDSSRNIALFACFIVFLFGIFRLSVRESTVLTLYTLAAYALVINLLMHFRPQAIQDVHSEWESWLGLAGFLPCYIIIGGQISDLRRRMRDSAQQLRLFADNVPAMAVYWDANLQCRLASRLYAEYYGFTVDNIVGKYAVEVLGVKLYGEIEHHVARAMLGHPVTYQRARILGSGEVRHYEIRFLPHVGPGGEFAGFFAVNADITEHKLTEERIQRVAHHDSLTGLPNRLLFTDRLEQAISLARRDSRKFALLYLDLDKFKPVNDTLGHTAGDQLLKEVAARIRHLLRESDTLARVGGDEFTVILPDVAGCEVAQTVARKIVATLAAPFWLGDPKRRIEIAASIGIAVYPVDAVGADALVKAADTAMYAAKVKGLAAAA